MIKSLAKRNENPINVWQREMSSLLDRFNRELDLPRINIDDYAPKIELKESDKGYVIKAEIPGMDDKDVDVSLKDNTLILEGERKSESKKEEKGHYFSEFSYGSFYRSIPLDDEVNPDKVKASCKHGVLTVELEKVSERQSGVKKIPISYS